MKIKLSDAFELQMGKTPSRNNLQYWNGTHKWISIGDLSGAGKYINQTKECISDSGVAESGIKIVPKGTVIMSFKLSIGKTAITAEDMYTNEAIMAFIDKGIYPIDTDYIYHLFSGMDWSEGTNKAVLGATLNKATLSEKWIDIPNMEEQKYVVNVLDKLNSLISLRRQQLAKLDELVKARFVEMFGDPVQNDKGWPLTSLGDIADIRIGPFGTMLHKEDYIEGGHALVNPSHIVNGKISIDSKLTISDEKYNELSPYALHIGDVVLGRRGEMGRCAVVYEDGLLCGTGSMIIRPNGKMQPYFLQNILSNPAFKKVIEDKAVGVTMMNLNIPIVSSLSVPLLPIELQTKFIEFMGKVDESKLTIQQSLDKLEVSKKALMQGYFSGDMK